MSFYEGQLKKSYLIINFKLLIQFIYKKVFLLIIQIILYLY